MRIKPPRLFISNGRIQAIIVVLLISLALGGCSNTKSSLDQLLALRPNNSPFHLSKPVENKTVFTDSFDSVWNASIQQFEELSRQTGKDGLNPNLFMDKSSGFLALAITTDQQAMFVYNLLLLPVDQQHTKAIRHIAIRWCYKMEGYLEDRRCPGPIPESPAETFDAIQRKAKAIGWHSYGSE